MGLNGLFRGALIGFDSPRLQPANLGCRRTFRSDVRVCGLQCGVDEFRDTSALFERLHGKLTLPNKTLM